jgi:preprotein translocase subunit SecA
MRKMLKKIFGSPEVRMLKEYENRVHFINELAPKYKKMTDEQLKAESKANQAKIDSGTSLDDILYEAFALVREVSERTLGQRPFDVQLVGGMVLHDGKVAEMKTGEGKTLVATLPIYLNALSKKGVHLVTVNDYLAQRDAGWMAKIYDFLGLSVSVIVSQASYIYDPEYMNENHEDERFQHLRECTRQEAYKADITYGMNSEFGFDYLRDNMVREASQLRQRELYYAIVDEVDSILIDEARTPLIISAPAQNSGSSYALFAQVARRLKPGDFEVDEKRRSATLTDEGVENVQTILGIENLYSPENVQVIYHLEQSLRAETLFKRDKDYVITPDGEIVIVDEFTGRLLHGRRYNEGLHQAIEAKEGVEVQQESMTLATISYQNYFRLYKKLSGMTGTAKTEEEEFQTVYNLDVVEVPTNMPIIREDRNDKIFSTEKGKFDALVSEVKSLTEAGQPVLIGTASIEKNIYVSQLLTKSGIQHEILNAKNHEREAQIVANAGLPGAVTLATNIAGRGTDIRLAKGVVEVGGLVVIGSERHESRRIDNQLRGRGGRQGDPGMTQFYVSAEDDLMRIFGGDRIKSLMERLGVEADTPIENKTLSKALENAQKKVESHNFDMRKNVVQYDDVMNRHRKATYTLRQSILKEENISDKIISTIGDQVKLLVEHYPENIEELKKELSTLIPLSSSSINAIAKTPVEQRVALAVESAQKLYSTRKDELGEEILHRLEREVYLQSLDTGWMQHLENMSHLREGIQWRSIGQRDPLVEYRREGQTMYEQMQDQLGRELVQILYRVQPPKTEEEIIETELTKAAENAIESGSGEAAAGTRAQKRARKKTDEGPTEPPNKSAHTTTVTHTKSRVSKAQRKRKKKAKRR